MLADDEVVHAGHFGELTVAQVEHFADDGEGRLVAFGNIAQVQQGHQCLRVGFLRIEAAVGQHDDVIVVRDLELLQHGAVCWFLPPGRSIFWLGSLPQSSRICFSTLKISQKTTYLEPLAT